MRLVVAVVGKARNAALGEAIRDYETRAARYWPLDVHEVREERATGIPLSSEQFAELLQSAREQDRDLAFLIGGAFGLSPSVARKSTMRLSLAPWTLPHEIARLVLVEQIYRAGTIVRGEPYHK
jgi:23S rRNA (pseudouridine1915-N3)-methyltransferase